MNTDAAHRPTILVAEDDPDTASLIAHHLRRNGYQPLLAHDGVTALNSVFQYKPALVILDRLMPELDGLKVCRMLKNSPARHTPILMLSALASPENKLEGFGSGADDYLTKPFEMRELIARVAVLLRRASTPPKH